MKGNLRRKYTALFVAFAMIFATFLPDTTLAVQAAGAAQRSASGRKVAVQNTRGNEDVEASILPAGEATEEDAKEGTTDYLSFEYTGSAITPQVKLMDGDTVLVKGTDYTLSYKNNKNAWVFTDENHFGEGAEKFNIHSDYLKSDEKELKKIPTVVVKFKGNYKGQRNLYYEIARVNVEQTDGDGTVDNQDNAVAWSCSVGNSGKDAVVYVNGKKLKLAKEKDKAGDFYVTAEGVSATGGSGGEGIQFKGNYTGFLPAGDNVSYDKSFKIKEKVKWNEEDGEFVAPSEEYNKEPWTAVYPEYPEGGHKNYHGKFAYYYDGNGKVAQVALDTKNYKLSKEPFVTALKGTTHPYTGVDITPVKSAKENTTENTTETIKDGEIVDASAIVNYADNIFPGSAKVTFTGIGPFSGQTARASFKIGFDSKGSNNGVFVVNEDEVNPAAVGATEDGDPIDVAYRNSGKYNNAGLIKSVSYEVGDEVKITGLKKDIDFKVTYKTPGKNVIGGDVEATLTGLGAFKGIKKTVKVGKIRKYSSEDTGITALIPDTDKADKVAAKNIKVFDQDGKAIPKTMYSLKEGEELSTEGGTHKFTVSLALQDKNKGAASEEDVTVDGFYSVYTDANKQIKKIAVKNNYPGIVGAPNFTNDKGAVIFTGEPIKFEGDPAGGALLVTTKGKEEKDTAAEGFDIFTERDETTGNGIYIDPDSYIDNVKKGIGKFTAYGTGEYFGKLTVSFKIAEDPSLEGNSGLSPSEPDPKPVDKDKYTVTVTNKSTGSSEAFELKVGDTAELTATVKKNDTVVENPIVEFSSSNTTVATVDGATGTVTAKKNGTATITASYKNKKGEVIQTGAINVTVVNNVYEMKLASDKNLDLTVGETSQILVTLSKNGVTLVGAQYTYVSDNEEAVTVSATGLITAAGKGKAVITVSYETGEGLPKTVKVYVTSKYSFASQKLDLTTAEIAQKAGSQRQITLSENIAQTNVDVAEVKIADDGSKVTLSSNTPGVTVITLSLKKNGVSDGTAVITATVSETGAITISDVKLYEEGQEVKYPVQLFNVRNSGNELMKEFDAIQPALSELMETKAVGTFEIAIPAGTYEEYLYYNGASTIILSGQGSKDNMGADVVVSKLNSAKLNAFNDFEPFKKYGPEKQDGYKRAMTRFDGTGNVVLENLTLKNPALKADTQAEAIVNTNTGYLAAYNCSFSSHQDTIQTSTGKAWFYNCYIEGDTDYTWIENKTSRAVALYENCELNALSDGSTSAIYSVTRLNISGTKFGKGQVFFGSDFTDDNVNGFSQGLFLSRSIGNGYDQTAFIDCTNTVGKTAVTPWQKDPVMKEGVERTIIGWKMDQDTATSLGYTSTLTGVNRDILTEEEEAAEFAGRRNILNRLYDTTAGKYTRDTSYHFDVDTLISDRRWVVKEDTSKEILDGEPEEEPEVYVATNTIDSYPDIEEANKSVIAAEKLIDESAENSRWTLKPDNTFTIPVKGNCTVYLYAYGKGEGDIYREGQGNAHFVVPSASKVTDEDPQKAYVNYSGAGNVIINASAETYITKIEVVYDKNLVFDPVTKIDITSAGDVKTIKGTKSLQFKAQVTPLHPTNADVTWSIKAGGENAAGINAVTGLLTAANVKEKTTVTVVCTANDGSQVYSEFDLTIEVMPETTFNIVWLDIGDGNTDEGKVANNTEAKNLATGSALTICPNPEDTQIVDYDIARWGSNPDQNSLVKGGIIWNYDNGQEYLPAGFGSIYVDLPVTAGDKDIAITSVKIPFGNHGTGNPRVQYSYTVGKDGERKIAYEGTDATRNATVTSPMYIPVSAGQTVYVRVALGHPEPEKMGGGNRYFNIGTIYMEGSLVPENHKLYEYNFSDNNDVATAYSAKQNYETKDGYVTLFSKNYQYNGKHGVVMYPGEGFTVKVIPGTDVTVQRCGYDNGAVKINITGDIDKTLKGTLEIPAPDPRDDNTCWDEYTYTYTGNTFETLTFTYADDSASCYLHGLKVRQGGSPFVPDTATVTATDLNLDLAHATITPDDSGVVTAEFTENKDGVVITSVKEGNGDIIVSTDDGEKWATISCVVSDTGEISTRIDAFVAATGISASYEDDKITGFLGDKLNIKAAIEPLGATNRKINWTTSDPETLSVNSVAEDDFTASIELKKIGTAKLTAASASNPTVTKVLTVEVKEDTDPVTKVTASQNGIVIDLYNGEFGEDADVDNVREFIDFETETLNGLKNKDGVLRVSVDNKSVVELDEDVVEFKEGKGTIAYVAVGTGLAKITANYMKEGTATATLTYNVVSKATQAAGGYVLYDDEVAKGQSVDASVNNSKQGIKVSGLMSNGNNYAYTSKDSVLSVNVCHPSVITLSDCYGGTNGQKVTVTNEAGEKLVDGVTVPGNGNVAYSFIYTGTTADVLTVTWSGSAYVSLLTVTPYENADGDEFDDSVTAINLARTEGSSHEFNLDDTVAFKAALTKPYINTDTVSLDWTLTTKDADGADVPLGATFDDDSMAIKATGETIMNVTANSEVAEGKLTVSPTGDAETKGEFEFTVVDGNPKLGGTWVLGGRGNIAEGVALDPTSGATDLKLYMKSGSLRDNGNSAQFGSGTVIYIPATAGTKVSVETYPADYHIEFDIVKGTDVIHSVTKDEYVDNVYEFEVAAEDITEETFAEVSNTSWVVLKGKATTKGSQAGNMGYMKSISVEGYEVIEPPVEWKILDSEGNPQNVTFTEGTYELAKGKYIYLDRVYTEGTVGISFDVSSEDYNASSKKISGGFGENINNDGKIDPDDAYGTYVCSGGVSNGRRKVLEFQTSNGFDGEDPGAMSGSVTLSHEYAVGLESTTNEDTVVSAKVTDGNKERTKSIVGKNMKWHDAANGTVNPTNGVIPFIAVKADYANNVTISNIKITYNEKKVKTTATYDIPAEAVIVNGGEDAKVAEGETLQLTAVFTPLNTTDKTLRWTSSNEEVATVGMRTGLVTGIAKGETEITATAKSGVSGTIKVTVTGEEPVTDIIITPSTACFDDQDNMVMTNFSDPITLSAAVKPDEADQKVTWATTSANVVTVSSEGVVTPKGVGECDITVTAGKDASGKDFVKTIHVIVTEAPEPSTSLYRMRTTKSYDGETPVTLSENSAGPAFVYYPVALSTGKAYTISADVLYSDSSHAGVGFLSTSESGDALGYAVATNRSFNGISFHKNVPDTTNADGLYGATDLGTNKGMMSASFSSTGELSFAVYSEAGELIAEKTSYSSSSFVSEGESLYLALGGGSDVDKVQFSNITVTEGTGEDAVVMNVDKFVTAPTVFLASAVTGFNPSGTVSVAGNKEIYNSNGYVIKTGTGDSAFTLIGYTDYLGDDVTEGWLSGTKVNYAIYNNKGDKTLLKIQGVEVGDKLSFYCYASNSSGKPGGASATIKINNNASNSIACPADSAGLKTPQFVDDIQLSAADIDSDGCTSFVITGRAGICAIRITPAE